MKRQKRRVGDIVRIPLSGNRVAYAMIMPLADIFFDFYSTGHGIPLLREIIAKPILFQIGVMNYAVTTGLWEIVGHVDPPTCLMKPPKFFMQDECTGMLHTTLDGGTKIPATYEECEQLECCAAWDPEHVVSRLEDHFAGRPNKWVELLRPKRMPT